VTLSVPPGMRGEDCSAVHWLYVVSWHDMHNTTHSLVHKSGLAKSFVCGGFAAAVCSQVLWHWYTLQCSGRNHGRISSWHDSGWLQFVIWHTNLRIVKTTPYKAKLCLIVRMLKPQRMTWDSVTSGPVTGLWLGS